MKKALVWWTSQSDAERTDVLLNAGLLSTWPVYIQDEFASRCGRSGRGRLWVADEVLMEFPGISCPWNDDSAVCKIASDAGGIAIHETDLHHVVMLPGFVTTVEMSLVHP